MPFSISLIINGEPRVITLDDTRVTLLDLLRLNRQFAAGVFLRLRAVGAPGRQVLRP